MLATRLATAGVLIPIIVVGIFTLPTAAVAAIFAVIVALGAWEWARLLGWTNSIHRAAFAALYVVVTAVIGWFDHVTPGLDSVAAGVIGMACIWWVFVIYWLVRYPAGWRRSLGQPSIGAIIGLLVLCAAALALPAIHARAQGGWLLLVFFALVWGADSGAYFVGRALGRYKLAPEISPGKTLEGAVGGVVVAAVIAAISAFMLNYSGLRLAGFILLGAWLGIVSVFGDLTVSMFKRHAEIKDTGSLFPGHGGVLDRLDSMLAAAPWFVAGLTCLSQG